MRRVLAGVMAAACLWAQSPQPPLGEAVWREDLNYFAAKFSEPGMAIRAGIATRGQKDFATLYPPASFQTPLDRLRESLGTLSDQEIALDLMRIVASANVAHTTVYLPLKFGFFRRLPLTLFWFPDGLGVIGAGQEYSDAIGARVLRIGTMTPQEALAAVAPYVSHETDTWLRLQAPGYLITLAMLEHLGLLGPDGRVTFTLEKPDGGPFTLAIPPGDPRVPQTTVTDYLHVPTPLYLSHPKSYYWSQYLGDSKTFYIQYNRCANDPKLPFKEFVRSALAEARSHIVRRVVVDLRLNGGGDSRVLSPLTKALASRRNTLGPVYVLTGDGTFSSGLMAALELKRDLRATLAGSAPGEKLNTYGEVATMTLPNSKLLIGYSTKYFRFTKDGDPDELRPDIPAQQTFEDTLQGRDRALEAVIAAKRPS